MVKHRSMVRHHTTLSEPGSTVACAAVGVAFVPTRAARALRLLGLASLGAAPVFALALGSSGAFTGAAPDAGR